MKKIIAIALSALLLFGCGAEEDQKAVSKLNKAVEKHNSENSFSGNYLLDITFGNESSGQYGTLYYAAGEVAWDKKQEKAYARFNQNYLGTAYIMENYFSQGKMISVEDGEAIESNRDTEELFSMFPYYSLVNYDSAVCKDLKKTQNTFGEAYSFYRSDTKEIFSKIFGDGIYDIIVSTTTMSSPQRDKTQYSDAKCVYTLLDGKVVSCRYEFDMTIFDTPAYIPGYTQDESKYTLKLHLVAKVEYDAEGEIIIKDYSETSSEASE